MKVLKVLKAIVKIYTVLDALVLMVYGVAVIAEYQMRHPDQSILEIEGGIFDNVLETYKKWWFWSEGK